ncbi:Quinone oxidoreductase 2 [Ferriphaselus amnicola]|uniref:Quinone oxidoreductase 2 n=1 Tax=Ferriphaselus amnicola TaxID=1188319 RepID=A0A2Z6GD77_9PROT|nr:SDR family oxidoreductase [Ferriphaselus amnicola]BBE51292.1 Quinone oxidoreductase 2 [Ferriphaselus amnicola]
MIVVTGATGQLGRLVIAALLKRIPATDIVAAVRNEDKAQDIAALGVRVRQADYSQPASWDAALQGADKLLLISSNEIGQRTQQHRNVIDAAQRAGVKLLAYTSVLRADTSPLGLAAEHLATETLLRTSGIPFVLLRNGWYTENYTAGIPTALSLGSVYGCAGGGRIASAARADYAEAAAVVLTTEDQAGKTYELAGDSAYTLSEFAAEVSRQSGKAIGYVDLPEAEYKKALLGAGLPEFLAELLANSDTGVAQGALFDGGGQLGRLIGRATTPLAAMVKAAM